MRHTLASGYAPQEIPLGDAALTRPTKLAHASELIEVELTRERATVLNLVKGQCVWLRPRQVKVFNVPVAALEEGGSGI